MRTPMYLIVAALLAAPIAATAAETPTLTAPAAIAPPAETAVPGAGSAATEARPRAPRGPRATSLTYTLNGMEKTRFIEMHMEGEAARAVEVTALGGTPVEPPAADGAWVMQAMGFKKVETPADGAKPAAAVEEGRDAGRRPRRIVTGLDGQSYTMNWPGPRGEGAAAAPAPPAGPNGEQVTKVTRWMKSDDGKWVEDTTAPGAGGMARRIGSERQRTGRPAAKGASAS